MKKLVSELSGAELDYYVAKAEGWHIEKTRFGDSIHGDKGSFKYWFNEWCPSKNPAQCWPIIEREKIGVIFNEKEKCWFASRPKEKTTIHEGETGLIAAMRCHVASVYGETVCDDKIPTQG